MGSRIRRNTLMQQIGFCDGVDKSSFGQVERIWDSAAALRLSGRVVAEDGERSHFILQRVIRNRPPLQQAVEHGP
jgi:hypothetical protein